MWRAAEVVAAAAAPFFARSVESDSVVPRVHLRFGFAAEERLRSN